MRTFLMVVYLSILGALICCSPDIDETIKAEYPLSLKLRAANNTDISRVDEALIVEMDDLKTRASDFNPHAFVIFSQGAELPSQAIDRDADGNPDQIAVIADFKPLEKKTLKFHYHPSGTRLREYPKRTQAELSIKVGGRFVNRKYEGGTFQNVSHLRVPPEHTDHSFYIRYEGPGWESDKVGYRFYLDWRNAVDIFGKKVPNMVLQNVGLDGFESYHQMSDWGADIFKVGESLGLGSIASWYQGKANRVAQTDSVTCAILASGPIFSQIRTKYFGWQVGPQKVNLTSDLSIFAGSRLTKTELRIDGELENICTGLAKHENTIFFSTKPERSGEWGYIGLWGKQSLASQEDELGIAVLYPGDQLLQLTEDDLNQVVVLKPENGRLSYYFLAAWVQEPNGIKTQQAFVDYLNATVKKLNQPIILDWGD
ncbi:MAG: DUF4861 domain-containing protein [candidate division KSB1 bacterium]|nr:DUF4861 domain-containing protein [candidate division KSB1 bacterium]